MTLRLCCSILRTAGVRKVTWLRISILCSGLLEAIPASAQSLSIDLGSAGVSERALHLVALITILSLAPWPWWS